MTTPFLGEIRMFGGNFAPRGNALCQGQLLSITQYSALFSLLGTYYGGNGTSTFGLPDMRSRIAVGMGQGPGLSNYNIGQISGTENVSLNVSQIPTHNHTMMASTAAAGSSTPGGNVPATTDTTAKGLYVPAALSTGALQLNPTSIGMAGGNLPHENRMPVLAISYIVALQGLFPTRS